MQECVLLSFRLHSCKANSPSQRKEEAQVAEERKQKKWQKDHAYDDIFTEEALEASSNQNRSEDFLDDFM